MTPESSELVLIWVSIFGAGLIIVAWVFYGIAAWLDYQKAKRQAMEAIRRRLRLQGRL